MPYQTTTLLPIKCLFTPTVDEPITSGLAEITPEDQNKEERRLSNFGCSMVVGLTLSETLDLLGFPRTTICTESGPKRENILCLADVGGEWANWLEMKERHQNLNDHSFQPRPAENHL